MNNMDRPTQLPALAHLAPGWFAIVMGWTGLALAWHRAQAAMGDWAAVLSAVAAVLAGLVCLVLLGASLWRWMRLPQHVHEDLMHPVRHAFFAAIPISLLLLATSAVALGLRDGVAGAIVRAIWVAAAALELAVTVWVLARWLREDGKGLAWAGITPVLFIPVVGNVIVPLAGVPLGYGDWAAAQFGVGVFFWPVVLTLLAVRIGSQGLWPARLLPTTFITVAPPAVVGLSLLQMEAPRGLAWAMWGIALFFLLWSATTVRRILAQAFGVPFWGMSFPLAAFAALSLRLAEPGWFQPVALLALALASLVILALSVATLKGLWRGTLLVPEPAPTVPIAVAPAVTAPPSRA